MGTRFIAALLIGGLFAAASAKTTIGPQTFVAQLYQRATRDPHFSYASPRILTADLFDLVQRDANSGKKIGAMAYDPICQCRDNDGLSAQIISITVSGDRAIAQVMLRFDAMPSPPPQRVTLLLTRTPLVGWKVADIRTSRIPSLRALLTRRASARG